MKSEQPSSNVYQLSQGRFRAIPNSPWVYWASKEIYGWFVNHKRFSEKATPINGCFTCDNFRFLRFWWEIGTHQISFRIKDREETKKALVKWIPYLKGGEHKKWYGNQDYVVFYHNDGEQIREFRLFRGQSFSLPGQDFYFKEGITWTDLGASGFSARINPGGFLFDVSGSCAFPIEPAYTYKLLAILNSNISNLLLSLLNPTIHFQIGDIGRLPVPSIERESTLNELVTQAIQILKMSCFHDEETFDFVIPHNSKSCPSSLEQAKKQLLLIEKEIEGKVNSLYGLSNDELLTFEANSVENEEQSIEKEPDLATKEALLSDIRDTDCTKIAVDWISYATGVVLGRFHPGQVGELGSGIYNNGDLCLGTLLPTEMGESNSQDGLLWNYSYVDDEGRQHYFSKDVEQKMLNSSLPHNLGVFDKNSTFDLVNHVQKLLVLMLGEEEASNVINLGAKGNLREFLSKDFFILHHLKACHKRPVHWYIQSSKRSYGFVIFHEKISKDTFYAIQREPYLDTKRNAVNLEMQDVQARIKQSAGGERKKLEERLADLRDLADELAQFAKDLEEITRSGYEPEPDWIDDGVILRMAPLWKVIPLWKSEPKKYWERLEAGDFDWSHIAMKYWPKRVREKCRKNKSYAIAHGHEEWYEGV